MAHKLIAASMVAGLAVAAAGPAHAADPAQGGWTQQSVPLADANILAVTSLDSHTVWSAGFTITVQGEGESFQPVVLSRDVGSGGAWQVVPTPAVPEDSRANAISAAGPDDVWVTGDGAGDATGAVLTEHWNGESWAVVNAPLPAGAADGGELLGVATLNAHDAWAVGNGRDGADIVGVIEHWDGETWQPSTLPASVCANLILNAVKATGPHDLWAGGVNFVTGRPVLLHGNGETWQQVSVPTGGAPSGTINALVPDGYGGLYALGAAYLTAADYGHPLVDHWNGRRWESQPAAPGSGVLLGGALTPEGLAVVGYIPGTGLDAYGEILHAGAWQSLNLPEVGMGSMAMAAATSTSAGLLAVGSYSSSDDGESEAPLALQESSY